MTNSPTLRSTWYWLCKVVLRPPIIRAYFTSTKVIVAAVIFYCQQNRLNLRGLSLIYYHRTNKKNEYLTKYSIVKDFDHKHFHSVSWLLIKLYLNNKFYNIIYLFKPIVWYIDGYFTERGTANEEFGKSLSSVCLNNTLF